MNGVWSDEPPTGEQMVAAMESTGRMVSESVDRLAAVVGGGGGGCNVAHAHQMQSEISALKEEVADIRRNMHPQLSSAPSSGFSH